MRRAAPALVFIVLTLAGLALAALVHAAPRAPAFARDWLRADALSALTVLLLGTHGLADWATARSGLWQMVVAAVLFGLASVAGHLALLTGLLVLGGLALTLGSATRMPVVATLCAASGLVMLGVTGGEWHYGAPGAGAGLNTLSFVLLLAGAGVASGAPMLVVGRAPKASSVAFVACLYALIRLFSLGPWNLGWLFATLVLGSAVAFGAAWQSVAVPPEQIAGSLGLYLSGLALVGVGLGAGAGLTLAGYALLTVPLLRLGAAFPGGPRWGRWLLSGAVPLTAPFIAAWMVLAAALAAGMSVLALGLWAAALLAAVASARLATRTLPAEGASDAVALVAPVLSLGLGLGAPLVLSGLLAPVVAQLQGGLTPFGELALWPWAGLIAFNAAKQPVATLPSLVLAALMLILSALCWLTLRLLRRGRG